MSKERVIDLSGAYNVRDLGGLPCADGVTTRHGVFIRGDSPHALNQLQQMALYEYGVRTMIDLRSPRECAAQPTPFALQSSIQYTHVPLQGTGLRAYDIRQITSIDRYYGTLLHDAAPQFATIFRTLMAAPASVYIHCRIGKDRTGIVTALILEAVGVDAHVIIDDYVLTTANIVPLIATYQSERPFFIPQTWYEGLFDAKAVYMQRFLRELASKYGGAEGYFATIGLPDMATQLRQRLCC